MGIEEALRYAASPDRRAQAEAAQRWAAVAKPLGSLGCFEGMITKIAGIQGTADVRVSPRCCLVFCGDHGVVEEGVTQCGSGVTARVARSIAEGTSNISLMAGAANADVFAVDMGMKEALQHPRLFSHRIAPGTANMTKGPAMTREQAQTALRCGVELVREMKARGYALAAVGEMGIGNTTACAALACALLGLTPEQAVGRGAGLSDEGLRRKRAAVAQALAVNRPDPKDPVDVLSKVGGFEIAGMAGAFIGGAMYGVPIVIDGVISAAAALIAARICPAAKDFMLPSHMSREPAAGRIFAELGLTPVLHADMALGEGTGAVMLFPLLDMALAVYAGEHTFSNLGMAAYVPQGER
ncbi:MAG: nicotinate-nucleotide--dimethylbenzimidazole phosphoribosyltransferase [Clostridia bacterium]|nr:nicotinate-nucleotide--dimethylbenzimidazole phosphoribosyltransferase [Clostridia bacterium]